MSGDHDEMAQYHVTVVSGDSSRTAAEAAADAGAEVIRKMNVAEGVAALATDEQIAALTEAGHTVHIDVAGHALPFADCGALDRHQATPERVPR